MPKRGKRVPQGGVLSPLLFNIYMSKMPTPTGTNMMVVSYADDTTTANSGNNLEAMCTEINSYLEELDKWFKERYLLINPTKSTATIFTTATAEINKELPIYINNTKVQNTQRMLLHL